MADELFALNAQDVSDVKEMFNWYKTQKANRPVTHRPPEQLSQATDILIARTPAGGIPALSEATETTGTNAVALSDDVPGVANCQVYQRIYDESAGTDRLVPTDQYPRIYNTSTVAVPGNVYVKIGRDRFGTWVVLGGAGDGAGVWVPDVSNIVCLTYEGTGTGTQTTGTGDDSVGLFVTEQHFVGGVVTGTRLVQLNVPLVCNTYLRSLGQGVVGDDGLGNCVVTFPDAVEQTVVSIACEVC